MAAAPRCAPASGWVFDVNGVGQSITGRDAQYAERGGDGLSRSSAIAQPFRNDFWLLDFVASRRWDDYELTASLGYARQYVFEQFDGVAVTGSGELITFPDDQRRQDFVVTDTGRLMLSPTASAPHAGLTQANRIHMFTAETRLARRGPNGTGWLVGISLLHNRAQVKRSMDRFFSVTSLTGLTNRVEEATLYGEAAFEPLDRFTVTLGGRLTHSRLAGRSQDGPEDTVLLLDPAAHAKRSETRVLPSLALAYRPDDALTLFARFQQSFRPGGIATRRNFIQRFKGDRVSTAEAGARYGNRRLDFAITAAWTDWSNIQADLVDGFGFPTTTNVGDGRVASIGFTSRWRPMPGLEFDASLYFNDTKVTDRFTILPMDMLTGNPGISVNADASAGDTNLAEFKNLPNIADISGRVGFAYIAPIDERLDFEANGFLRYVGKSTLGVGPILGQLQGDYVDTGLEFRISDRNRGLSLTLTNLLDSRGNRFALGSLFLVRDRNQITPLQPRTIRLGFDMSF